MLAQMTVIGRACADPNLIETKTGTMMCRVRLATNHTKRGEKVASFWSVVAFGKRAELLAGNLKKGARVAIVGPASIEEWTNKEGNTATSVEIVCEQCTILDWPEMRESRPGENEHADDVIPF